MNWAKLYRSFTYSFHGFAVWPEHFYQYFAHSKGSVGEIGSSYWNVFSAIEGLQPIELSWLQRRKLLVCAQHSSQQANNNAHNNGNELNALDCEHVDFLTNNNGNDCAKEKFMICANEQQRPYIEHVDVQNKLIVTKQQRQRI